MKKIIGLLIILGSLTWIITMFKSGLKYDYGLGFWGPNGHDGIWHIALANNLSELNFSNPVFASSNIKNYHIGFDLILGLLSKLTFIPISILYFQALPVIFAIMIGILTYQFVNLWTKNKIAAILSTLFTYFGGSMAWVLGKGESTFWSQQPVSTLINPPFALSLILILLGLIFLQKKKLLLSVLCFGILIQIKAYAAILVLAGLFISGLYSYLIRHSSFVIKIFTGALVLNLVLVFVISNNGPASFKFEPFWFLETMMSSGDRLGWQRFYSAMTTYKMGDMYVKEILAFGLAFTIFIVGNFWTRLLFLKDLFKKIDNIKIISLSIIVAGIVLPMLFVQSGTPWNTIQFMYYSLFFSGILAGMAVNKFSIWVLEFIILITVPTTVITLKDVYIPSRPPAKLSNAEIEALNFLKHQPEGIVLTYPFDKLRADEAVNNPPRPLYLYESTAYVSAFSKKTVFLEDEVNLNITGYNWSKRREEILAWLKEPNQEKARQFLKGNNIKYVYWVKPQKAFLGEGQLGLLKIFENNEAIIYLFE